MGLASVVLTGVPSPKFQLQVLCGVARFWKRTLSGLMPSTLCPNEALGTGMTCTQTESVRVKPQSPVRVYL